MITGSMMSWNGWHWYFVTGSRSTYPKKQYYIMCHKFFLAFLLVVVASMGAEAQSISGTVFRDFNADGLYTSLPASGTYSYGEPGIGGVSIRAYNSAGTEVATVYSNSLTGSYSLTGLTTGQTYRIEFGNLPGGDYETTRGRAAGGSATSIQFVKSPSTAVNFGLNYPNDYCQQSPPLIVPCFVSGDPLASNSTVADEHVLVNVPYTAQGTAVVATPLADAKHIGSVWGAAYQRETKKLFTAAFLKRHVGLGPAGLGGIYVTNTTGAPTPSLYVDLESAPFNLNLGASRLTGRTLPVSGTASSTDPLAFSAVGTVGLGGLALSTDGTVLYAVDLFNRKLLALKIGNPAATSLSGANLTQINLPDPACNRGVARPFAVTVQDSKVFIGMVCTGENGGSASDLYAHIYAMNEGATAIPSIPVLSFRLNYSKGQVHTGDSNLGDNWETWVTQFNQLNIGGTISSGAVRVGRPQPMITDITFADDGDMIVAFSDRSGHQLGYEQRNTTDAGSNPTLYNGYIGGDLLRANYTGTGWVLEQNATLGPLASVGSNNGQGPGTPTSNGYSSPSGEFFFGENYSTIHEETGMGSGFSVPGLNQTIVSIMDPFDVFTGGFGWFDNTTGASVRRAQLYDSNSDGGITYGKANGLGVIKALCDAAPVQIGNRVWSDLNNNGVQDAAEPGISGVLITLKGPNSTTIGTVTTNAQGEYYFTNAAGTDGNGYNYGVNLTYGGSYSLCFPTSASGLALSSQPNAGTGTSADYIDSDPTAAGVIVFTLGQAGQNNFSYDAGYVPCALSFTATPGSCNPTTNRYAVTGTVTFTATPGGSLTIIDDGANTPAVATVLSVSAGQVTLPFTLTGLVSGGRQHVVSVSFSTTDCGTQSLTYLSPTSCIATPCVGTNLLTNPSFEQGLPVLPVGQTLQSPPVGWTGGTADNNPNAGFAAPDGYAFAFSGDNGGTLCQSVSATAGNTYQLTFYAGVHQLNGQRVTLSFLNSNSAVLGTPASFSITHILENTNSFGGPYSLSGVAQAGTAQVRVCGVSGNGVGSSFYVKLDNLCLTGAAAPCAVSVAVPPPVCNTTTNQYALSGTLSLTSAVAGTATLTDGTTSATLAITTGQASAPFTLTGLRSGTGAHNLLVTLPGCGSASVGYTAPPLCASLTLGSATVCAGQTVSLTAIGCPQSVLFAGGGSVNGNVLTISTAASLTTTAIFTYTAICTSTSISTTGTVTVNPLPSLTLTQTPSGTVTTGSTVTLTAQGCTGGTLRWSDNTANLNGNTATVMPNRSSQVYSATCTTQSGCVGSASLTVTAVEQPAQLVLVKQVSTSRARLGDLLTYTVVLANVGLGASEPVSVTDVMQGVVFVPSSATSSRGSFISTPAGGVWTLPALPASTTVSLVYTASVAADGVVYNTAKIPSQTATVCTSVPMLVCDNNPIAILLTAPAGYSRYKWFRLGENQPVYDGPLNSFTATQAGEYRVSVVGSQGACTDGSCCPVVIEAVPFPPVTALAVAPSCQGNVPLSNGQIKLASLASASIGAGLLYQISTGTTFDTERVLAQGNVPIGGLLADNLGVGVYTVRLTTSTELVCQQDFVITVLATCVCPAPKCVPIVIKKTKGGAK
ncbi:DUF11 domain-containing protein [Rudanella paleaurantiibacter]|uniref:DUF11 domain-containing protein n=2 Tax=Rudanella paleaurantiibacter TaxID=2614655 RepID=A0A7J5TT23_9BACT|nr:DUF11 domain-containing protein [Rudanella paleaurantiibacter]